MGQQEMTVGPSTHAYSYIRGDTIWLTEPSTARGPCPILNTMANHGLIPRSGRNITTDHVIFGLSRGLNVARDIAVMATENAIQLNPAKNASSFDLPMLSQHNAIEHDNSLTRTDAYFGDQATLNRTVLDQTMSFLPNQVISLEDATRALTGRIRHSQNTNPRFVFDLFGSTSTTASYMAVMGDAEKGEAVRAWVKYLFGMPSLTLLFLSFLPRPWRQQTLSDRT
jgi:hypothetical protein